MDIVALHWEWRTFGREFGAAEAELAALEPELVRESDEIYLLSFTTDAGVKIRAGLAEIKKLEEVDEAGLERWWLAMSEPLPLPRVEANRICTALGVPALPPGNDAFSLGELLAVLTASERGVRAVAVHKVRRLYAFGGCRSEVADVVVGGERTRTLAVEAEDATRVIAAVQELGLLDRDNTSYPRWLMTAVERKPREQALRGEGA